MWSFWELDVIKSLDVVVVGSGFTGISAAISLKEKEPSLNIGVVDRDPISFGASSRNAGFSCFGSITELEDDLNHSSLESLVNLVERRFHGIEKTLSRVSNDKVHYSKTGGYELITKNEVHALDRIAFWNDSLKRVFGKNVFSMLSSDSFHFSEDVEAVIKHSEEGMLHPVHLLIELKRVATHLGAKFFSGLNIDLGHNLDELHIQSERGKLSVQPKQILLATNAFTKKLYPKSDITPGRGQVLVTNPIEDLALEGTFHYNKGYVYFRNVGNRILIGGGRDVFKQKEETFEMTTSSALQNYLRQLLNDVVLPRKTFEVAHEWSGIMAFGENKSPLLESINNRVVVAARLGGMGVALASQLGEDAADMIMGKMKNPIG